MEYTITSFFRDLSTIQEKTFQPFTIKNSFNESEMFPVSYKKALKKMRSNNKAKLRQQPSPTTNPNSENNKIAEEPSMEEGGLLELPTLPSTYFESQKGMR